MFGEHGISSARCGENFEKLPAPPPIAMHQLDTLKSDLADVLLASESPVATDAAFQRIRREFADFKEKHRKSSALIALLQNAFHEVSQSEQALQQAGQSLKSEQKQLTQCATRLGEAAFAALQSEEIPASPRFQSRQELQAKIDSLKLQKSSLTTGESSGVIEQASLQAQQLKLIGQLKVEELKIHSVNRKLGDDILSAGEEEKVRCRQTESILQEILQQRKSIHVAQQNLHHAEEQVAATRQQAADQINEQSVSDAKWLNARLKQEQGELRSAESHLDNLREEVVHKALEYEWLRDKPELKESLEQIAQIQEESTPRKLSIWPLAAIVIAGHLLSSFGSEPLNLSAVGVLVLYLVTGLGGLGLLAYYKPELATGERRVQSLLLLFAYSIISVVCILLFQQLAEYAIHHWSDRPEWAKGRLILLDLPRMFLVAVGTAYRDTFAMMQGTAVPESFPVYFRNHMLSVGLCEELIKLSPALVALAALTGEWTSRSKEFNSRLVYLALIGGLAFGLGEAVHYHFAMYSPMGAGWGLYAIRFLSLVTIHAVWAGISGWILAHVTGGWIRKAFTTAAQGWGPVGGCLVIAATVGVSDFLHTSHNLSSNPLWMLAWDIVSLALFAWLIRCSNVTQLVPQRIQRFGKRGFHPTDLSATAMQFQELASSSLGRSTGAASETHPEEASSETALPSERVLWNPNAAGLWSLILTPIFGAWLHAKNWHTLGEPIKARTSMWWVYASAAALVATALLSTFLPLLFRFTYGSLLVAWWIKSGNEQHQYVKQRFPDYQKKRWGTPLSIAGLVGFGFVTLAAAWAVNIEQGEASSQLIGTWSINSQQTGVDEDTGIHQHMTVAGEVTYHQDGMSSTQATITYTLTSKQGEQLTYQLAIETQGEWVWNGTTLSESTTACHVTAADNAARSLEADDSTWLATLEKEILAERTSVRVTFTTADEVELIDQETGFASQMTRVQSE